MQQNVSPCRRLNFTTKLTKPTKGVNYLLKYSNVARATYIQQFSSAVDGWCGIINSYFALLLTHYQHQRGIFGSIGEIGVHHGKFFISLAHTAASEPVAEQLFVCDLFGRLQHLNIDKSGKGDRPVFERNLQHYGIGHSDVIVHEGSSLDLSQDKIDSLSPGLLPFRMFSVDGGHTFRNALADIQLSACIIADGGVIALDDIFQSDSIQNAMEHIVKFGLCPDLRPFLVLDNKLWLTTASHLEDYIKFALDTFLPIVKADADLQPQPQVMFAPTIAPRIFGNNVPVIAYSPSVKAVENGTNYSRITARWIELSRSLPAHPFEVPSSLPIRSPPAGYGSPPL